MIFDQHLANHFTNSYNNKKGNFPIFSLISIKQEVCTTTSLQLGEQICLATNQLNKIQDVRGET